MAESPKPSRRAPPRRRLIIGIVLLAVVGLIAWMALRPHGADPVRYTGYVVSHNLYMSSPVAGALSDVAVARGQRIEAGAALFRIDPTSLGARANQAQAQIGQTEAQLGASQADLAKALAALAVAKVDAAHSAADLARYQATARDGSGAVAAIQVDQARAAAEDAARRRDQAAADVAGAEARIAAGRAEVAASQAGLVDARQQVDQLAPRAPVAARVEDVLYQKGEWAAANAPIVSLVPDNQVKVRFYVPQSVVAAFKPEAAVAIACDGCAGGMTARVDYVASRPEYTPPVIYSLATRDKLVFMVEATPSAPRALVPGQPIDVSPLAASRPAAR